jgi:pyridoxamine 5'-phosphate oxidase
MQDLSDKRKDYSVNFINFSELPENPYELFNNWYNSACNSSKIDEAYAMNLSTIGNDGFPRTRIVLLREFNQNGFIFYTNYNSEKGKSIAENPNVCLSFFWDKLEQQIIIKGTAEKISPEKSDDYFYKRPEGSQIGAIVSPQSSVIGFEEDLDEKAKSLKEELKEIKRPENWGGYIVKPVEFEFWQGRPSRLHHRLRYRLRNGIWLKERLAP